MVRDELEKLLMNQATRDQLCLCRTVDDVIQKVISIVSDSHKLSVGYSALEEQDPTYWEIEATEQDGYHHKEVALCRNALHAFAAATEFSPSYHTEVKVRRLTDEEAEAVRKELSK